MRFLFWFLVVAVALALVDARARRGSDERDNRSGERWGTKTERQFASSSELRGYPKNGKVGVNRHASGEDLYNNNRNGNNKYRDESNEYRGQDEKNQYKNYRKYDNGNDYSDRKYKVDDDEVQQYRDNVMNKMYESARQNSDWKYVQENNRRTNEQQRGGNSDEDQTYQNNRNKYNQY